MEKDVSLADIRKESRLKDNCVSLGIEYIIQRQDETDDGKSARHHWAARARGWTTLQRSITTTSPSKSLTLTWAARGWMMLQHSIKATTTSQSRGMYKLATYCKLLGVGGHKYLHEAWAAAYNTSTYREIRWTIYPPNFAYPPSDLSLALNFYTPLLQSHWRGLSYIF
jgi:hypothetical protein